MQYHWIDIGIIVLYLIATIFVVFGCQNGRPRT